MCDNIAVGEHVFKKNQLLYFNFILINVMSDPCVSKSLAISYLRHNDHDLVIRQKCNLTINQNKQKVVVLFLQPNLY